MISREKQEKAEVALEEIERAVGNTQSIKDLDSASLIPPRTLKSIKRIMIRLGYDINNQLSPDNDEWRRDVEFEILLKIIANAKGLNESEYL